jgi:hypothetical protein
MEKMFVLQGKKFDRIDYQIGGEKASSKCCKKKYGEIFFQETFLKS